MANRREESWRPFESFDPEIEQDEPLPYIKELFDDENSQRGEYTAYLEKELKNDKALAEKIFPFSTEFTRKILHNQHIVLIGDSLTRAIYKDLIGLLQNDNVLHWKTLKKKSETSHMHDRQIDCLSLDSDRVFRQAREYMSTEHLIQYFFTTRVMKGDIDGALLQMQRSNEFPDALILNSALWDLTRYHHYEVDMRRYKPYDDNPHQQIYNEQDTMEEYLHRLAMLLRRLRCVLPPTTQVIWLLMPWPLPHGNNSVTGRIDTEKTRKLHRSIYCDGNYRAAQLVVAAGYDVLDLGFSLRNHSLYVYRVNDGVHWDAIGTRMMTQMIIGHLAKNLREHLPDEIKKKIDALKDDIKDDQFGEQYMESSNCCTKRYEEDDRHTGCYCLVQQRELTEKAFRNMPEEMRKLFKDDIATMRASEFIRLNKLEVREEDDEAIEEMVKNFPRVLSLLKPNDFKPQRLILRPTSNNASSSSKKQ